MIVLIRHKFAVFSTALALLLFACVSGAYSNVPEMQKLRDLYFDSSHDRQCAERFLKTMEELKIGNNALLLGYRGIANMMQAKHSGNPYSKLSYFTKGKNMLEYAVYLAPEHTEIRFLRFCIQTNVPFFLGYSQNIEDDKAAILKSWLTIPDSDLKNKIKQYMLESDYCTEAEKSSFR